MNGSFWKDGHFWLAILGLAVYVVLAGLWSQYPSKLPGDVTGQILGDLFTLVTAAWIWWFAKSSIGK